MIKYDILICGIGGQGVISLGSILKLAAIKDGIAVVGAERRGGAQREGIVTSNVRYRKAEEEDNLESRLTQCSGSIPAGGADMLISMEPLEALRHVLYVHEKTVMIVNDFPLMPVSVRMGYSGYPNPKVIEERLQKVSEYVYFFPMDDMSKTHFQDLHHVNVICLGLAFALGQLPVSEESLLSTVKERLPGFEDNQRGFYLGKDMGEKALDNHLPAREKNAL